jgi:hypothetical protein
MLAEDVSEADADAIIAERRSKARPEPPPPKPEPPQGTFQPVKFRWWWPVTEPRELRDALSAIMKGLRPITRRQVGAEINVPAFARDLCWHPRKVAALVRYWARQGEFKIVFAEGDIIRLTKIDSEPAPRPAPIEPPPAPPPPEDEQPDNSESWFPPCIYPDPPTIQPKRLPQSMQCWRRRTTPTLCM